MADARVVADDRFMRTKFSRFVICDDAVVVVVIGGDGALVVILFTYSSSVSAFCVLMPLFRWLTLLLLCVLFFSLLFHKIEVISLFS